MSTFLLQFQESVSSLESDLQVLTGTETMTKTFEERDQDAQRTELLFGTTTHTMSIEERDQDPNLSMGTQTITNSKEERDQDQPSIRHSVF